MPHQSIVGKSVQTTSMANSVGDIIGDPGNPQRLIYGAQVVYSWGSDPSRTLQGRGAATAFLVQWPEGPQIYMKNQDRLCGEVESCRKKE
ncbi:MAG: hypothetical protein V1714_00005 [Pseudomonadota bacterium]